MKKTVILFISFFMSVASEKAAQAVELPDIDVHGFISQGYLKTDNNNYLAETEDGTFQFNEMGINFSADPTDLLHIGVQFFARDLGMVGNDDVILDWAFADYRWQNWMGIRVGKIKIDYGLYNETREIDMLRTSVMLPQSVYPEVWRRSFSAIKGIAFYGYLPLGAMGRLAYDGQLGVMEFREDEGFAKSIAPRMEEDFHITSIDSDYAWFGSIRWNTMLPGFITKMTYYDIKGMEGTGDLIKIKEGGGIKHNPENFEVIEKDGYVFSFEYTWKNLILTAEYAKDNFQIARIPGGQPQPEPPPQGNQPSKETSEGWYISGSYRLSDWFELGMGYSEYYPDIDDKDGKKKPKKPEFISWLKTTTLSTRFDINDYWILKLETSYNDGFGGINLAGNPDKQDRYWYLFAAKMTFSF
ncbi:MAG: hypothetical protein GY749_09355 [Desulfobacteraceae bacterium]|nr:hypothetical protein [Desulfobacteraceae bacterium]